MIIPSISDVFDICRRLVKENAVDFSNCDFIVGVSRGGLIPAALIATRINKPLVTAYINKKDKVFFDRGDWIKGKKVIIVDDAVRTGKTLTKIEKLIKKSHPSEIKLAVMYKIPEFKDDIIFYYQNIETVKFPWDIDIN